MATFHSVGMNDYPHGEDGNDSIIRAGDQQLDLDYLSWKLQQPEKPKSRLTSYFKAFMMDYKEPPPLEPSPISSRCSSPSRDSAGHSSDSSESNQSMDLGRRVVVKTAKTKESRSKRDVIKRPTKRVYRVGKVDVTRSQRKLHELERRLHKLERSTTKSRRDHFLALNSKV